MMEVIMCHSGEGEDSYGLKQVGKLVRCRDCGHNKADDYVDCERLAGMFGRDTDNYCSLGAKKEDTE